MVMIAAFSALPLALELEDFSRQLGQLESRRASRSRETSSDSRATETRSISSLHESAAGSSSARRHRVDREGRSR